MLKAGRSLSVTVQHSRLHPLKFSDILSDDFIYDVKVSGRKKKRGGAEEQSKLSKHNL